MSVTLGNAIPTSAYHQPNMHLLWQDALLILLLQKHQHNT